MNNILRSLREVQVEIETYLGKDLEEISAVLDDVKISALRQIKEKKYQEEYKEVITALKGTLK